MAIANLTFVSSLQRGMNAGLTRADQIPTGFVEDRVQFAFDLTFDNGAAQPSPAQTSSTHLGLIGPGDVVGLDPRAVVRTYPRRDDNDAEFGFFAAVELDQADLPWRYSPAKPAGAVASSTDTLRPWLTLIVLAEGSELATTDITSASLKQKLPLVSVRRKHLPAENEIWAWAHLQANDTIGDIAALEAAIGGAPGRVVARVMSPRVLQPQTAYRAFLVPTFERGRRIVTGETLDQIDSLAPAWVRPADDDLPGGEVRVTLPFYYDFRFQTGTAGSFEALIEALVPGVLDETIGRRQMAVASPGLNLRDPAPGPISTSGALESVAASLIIDPGTAQQFIDDLKAFVDVSQIQAVDEDGTTRIVKVVSPPLYGRWYAAQSTLVNPPQWFFSLNSDPRYRVAAALGTQVVQNEQQSLMDAAWLQIDQLRTINAERKVLQIARQVFGRYMARYVSIGFVESQLTLTARLHSHLLFNSSTTVFGTFAQSQLGAGFLTPQWRRFISPRGFLGRRFGLPKLPAGTAPNIFSRINDGSVLLAPTPVFPAGAIGPQQIWGPTLGASLTDQQVTALRTKLGASGEVFWGLVLFWVSRKLLIDMKGQYWWLLQRLMRFGFSLIRLGNDPTLVRENLRKSLLAGTLSGGQLATAPAAPTFTMKTGVRFNDPNTLPTDPGPLPAPGATDSLDAQRFRAAAIEVLNYLGRGRTQPTLNKVDLVASLKTIMDGLSPSLTLLESQKSRLVFDTTAWKATDQLEPIQSGPQIDRPMYEPLRDISNDWILPGVGDVPDNTIGLLVPNQKFIEAYMAGLNHEMTRELVWNEFPVDQRGTYFRQFWDSRAFVNGPQNVRTPDQLLDIAPIRDWPPASNLGDNSPRPPSEGVNDPRVVLLVKGQLIKRYPNTVVYAANSATFSIPADPSYDERHPIFHGFLGSDVAYYAFDLKLSDVKDPSDPWFFVLQEMPAEPRFGVPDDVPRPTVPYARAAIEFTGKATAATVATRAFHHPFRIAVKGSSLVTPPSP